MEYPVKIDVKMVVLKKFSLDDFDEIDQRISQRKVIKDNCRGCESLRQLLVYTKQFEELKEFIEHEHSELLDDHQSCIQLVSKLLTNTIEDIYISLRHFQYISGYRGYRYLYETFLLLRGLNKSPEKSAEIYKTFLIELDTLVGGPSQWPLFKYDHIDELGRLKDSEWDKMNNKTDRMRSVYDLLSTQANHPLRLDKTYTQGVHHENFERDVAGLALWTLVGVMSEFYLAFDEDTFPEECSETLGDLCHSIITYHADEIPSFLEDYYTIVQE